MKATVLIDNISNNELVKEWGLCIWIEYGDKKILLDTGGSGKFLENAKMLGIDIGKADFGVLSHAHYDHADGMETFFEANKIAPFYLREGSQENCYSKHLFVKKYIGIHKGTLEKYSGRIQYAKGDLELCEGMYLMPHKSQGLAAKGKKAGMYRLIEGKYRADDFSHEQSLVFRTEQGLVIFNSCSHGGADTIIKEVEETFLGESICALIGGFHLFMSSESKVRELANGIRQTGIEALYTGHCTGQKAFAILAEELPGIVHQLYTGLVIEF